MYDLSIICIYGRLNINEKCSFLIYDKMLMVDSHNQGNTQPVKHVEAHVVDH